MRLVFSLLPAIGCGAVMFVCVRMMAGHSHGKSEAKPNAGRELAELRDEVAHLKSKQTSAPDEDSAPSPAPKG